MHIENLMTMNIPRTAECLVQDLLCPEQISVMYGPPNTGKTFIALELARCISAGQPFLGLETKKAGVFLVELEGRHGMAKRAKAIQTYFPINHSDSLVLIQFDSFNLQVESLDRHFQERFEKCSFHPKLLIIDTLSMAMNGADENSSAMTSTVMSLKGIAKTCGTHVMVIHHSGKDPSKGARGHSSLKGAVDTEILIHDNKLSVTKQRDLPKISPIPFRLEVVDLEVPEGFQPMSSCVVLPANAEVRRTDQQLLLNILKTFSASDDIIDLESVKREWVDNKPDIQPESALRGFNRARDALVKQGLLTIDGDQCRLLSPDSANDDDYSGTNLSGQSDRHPPL
jgi:KaiC/GvpD/RAD55 family RecA-like ATPase